jgi:hypothetical protein
MVSELIYKFLESNISFIVKTNSNRGDFYQSQFITNTELYTEYTGCNYLIYIYIHTHTHTHIKPITTTTTHIH